MSNEPRKSDFIRTMVSDDLRSGKYHEVITRFPPEPNGYLHIGHAKSICLNFGIANEFEPARCHLRFDDTNPETEDIKYVESIINDVKWLGYSDVRTTDGRAARATGSPSAPHASGPRD